MSEFDSDFPLATPARWFIFAGSKLLMADDTLAMPLAADPSELPLSLRRIMVVHSAETEQPQFTAEVDEDTAPLDGYSFQPIRALFGADDDLLFPLAGRAIQLIDWDRNHRYCGRCGTETVRQAAELSRKCPNCGLPHYPRIAPAIIVSVERPHPNGNGGTQLLLAHNARYDRPFFSVLAGFVEPGETLEQCVAREIWEEVGIEVCNIRYFGSQPWPFPNSLMIAFQAEYVSGELVFNDHEIDEAHWFDSAELPPIPSSVSIARALIDDFVARNSAEKAHA